MAAHDESYEAFSARVLKKTQHLKTEKEKKRWVSEYSGRAISRFIEPAFSSRRPVDYLISRAIGYHLGGDVEYRE